MAQPSEAQREVMSLLMAVMDGELDATGRARLNDLCRHSSACRRTYTQMMGVHGMLLWRRGISHEQPLAARTGDNSILLEVLDQERAAREERELEQAAAREKKQAELAERRRLQLMLAGHTDKPEVVRNYVIPRPIFYGGIAAAIALVALVLWPMTQKVAPQPGHAPAPQVAIAKPAAPQLIQVATLIEQVGAQWEGASHPLRSGEPVWNEPIKLTVGLAKLRFDNGAEVVLQAPVSIEPLSATELRITTGKLVGLCETEASKGFAVLAPNAKIVDLGTEFGVDVDETGTTTTQVFHGEAKLSGIGDDQSVSRTTILTAGMGQSVDAHGTPGRIFKAQPLDYVRGNEFSAQAKAGASAYHRWLAYSYELRRDPDLLAYYTFEKQDTTADTMFSVAIHGRVSHGLINGLAWGQGRFPGKGAIHFTPADEGVRIVGPGPLDEVACIAWIKLDTLIDYPQAIIHSDDAQLGGLHWMISDMGGMGFGNIHLLMRAEKLITSRNIGSWHQVAVAYGRDEVKLYFDGAIRASKPAPGKPLVFAGARLGSWDPQTNTDSAQNRSLRGYMDECLVFGRALSDDEIAEIYRRGRPR